MTKSYVLFLAIFVGIGSEFGAGASAASVPAAPIISSFNPSSGPPGTSVEIKGTNLAEITTVQFNGVNASFSVLGGIVVAGVPTNALTGPITVIAPGGTNTTSASFTITAQEPPSITGILPIEGNPGTVVEIKGTKLAEATAVQFNGVGATFSALGGSLFATVPVQATTGPITVVSSTGRVTSAQVFTVLQLPPPVVTRFLPASGGAGVSVEIQGSHLVSVSTVQFNGMNASFLLSGGSLRATVPANATSGPITVITAGGAFTTKESFNVTLGPLPTISSIQPSSGEIGTAVEIRGQFLRDVISVQFNGAAAVFTNALFRPLTAFVPTNATTGPITVVTRAGAVTSSETFAVINPVAPMIERLDPASGETGSLVRVHGDNLLGVTAVSFQGVPASFIEFQKTQLFVFVPTNAPSGPITVTTRTGMAVSKGTFTVIGAPAPLPVSLAIQATAPGQIEVSWPADALNFVLEASENLGSESQWTKVADSPRAVLGRMVVTVSARSSGFYRLSRP